MKIKKRERLSGMLKKARPHLVRLLCLLFIFSFLLPYVDVLGCSSKKIETFYGYQLIRGAAAAFYIAAMALLAAVLALSFYRNKAPRALRAFGAAWRAMAAAAAGFIVWLLPGIQFLFDNVYMLVGQFLALACSALVFIDAAAVSSAEYAALRQEALPPEPAQPLPPALRKVHWAAVFISLALVPLYVFALHSEVPLAVMYFLFLSLPFLLSEAIALEGVRRGERWTLRLAPAVMIALAGALALTILSFF